MCVYILPKKRTLITTILCCQIVCVYMCAKAWLAFLFFSLDVDTVDRLPGEVTERFGWLEEIDVPQDLKMFAVEYLGPQIIDN